MPFRPPLMRDQVKFYVTPARRETYITRERGGDIGFFHEKKKGEKEQILDTRVAMDYATRIS